MWIERKHLKYKIDEQEKERIRKRHSYQRFQEIHDFFKKSPSVAEILKYIHELIDGMWGYGSDTNAGYAEESLQVFLQDHNLNKKSFWRKIFK